MRILFISLGCDKNLVDSEEMITLLSSSGHEMVDDEAEADAIIINTCCFIQDAKEESVNTILEMARYRREGRLKALIVTGCLAQRYRTEILDEIPEVDAIIGTSSYPAIVQALNQAAGGEKYISSWKLDMLPETAKKRILTTGGHYGYLKIAEGCDKHCTYCIIPSLRGHYRSVPMESLVSQAMEMAGEGVKELILVAQETTLYGIDLYGKKSLHLLLRRLCRIDGIRWIRLLYCYPEEIYDELIETIREEKKICHYLDLPIQHASDRILARMGRRTTRQSLTAMIEKLREEIPDIVLRTTLITGFPGESQEDFIESYNFADEMEFDRLGVFPYSQEEDTPAASFPDQIPPEIAKNRITRLIALQEALQRETLSRFLNQEEELLVESVSRRSEEAVSGKGRHGISITLPGSAEDIGKILRCRITKLKNNTLIGERIP